MSIQTAHYFRRERKMTIKINSHGFVYPITITNEHKGEWLVTFPDFDYGVTSGDSYLDAKDNASDCLAELLANCIVDGDSFPIPSVGKVVVSPDLAFQLKLWFITIFDTTTITQSDFAASLGVDGREVRRWLDVSHNTKIATLQRALRAIGEVEITITTSPT